ncbi:hypothetical protein XFF6991_260003 [Xanthomonas phaseoli pv. phaseoli]|uniref:Uncharacterized protein n=1 Tax=Xanthomonas campestris pv. phaseoli TaxID=317013 RepID=A0A7Z7IX93_XANCH|nr:hypothetical protein XFF6991_260003 [Xanthomonas phaseoli pv. phaseoli]
MSLGCVVRHSRSHPRNLPSIPIDRPSLHYSAQEHSRVGSELVFFSDNLTPPDMDGVTSRYRRPWAVEEFASHVA